MFLFQYGFFYVFLHRDINRTIMAKNVIIVMAIAAGAIALMMAALGLKMLLHKEKEFRRPCANADPKTGRCAHCTCGRDKH